MTNTQYINQVNTRFKAGYSCTVEDLGIPTEQIIDAKNDGQTADEFVEWFAEKYDLTRREDMDLDTAMSILQPYMD